MNRRITFSIVTIFCLLLTLVGSVTTAESEETYPDMVGNYTGKISIKQVNQDASAVSSTETFNYSRLEIFGQSDNLITSANLSLWRKCDNQISSAYLTIPCTGFIGSNSTKTSPSPYLTLTGDDGANGVFIKCRVKLNKITKLPTYVNGITGIISSGGQSGEVLYEHYDVTDNIGCPMYGSGWEGQSFTPSIAHTITSVWFKLCKYGDNPGNVTASIRATNVTTGWPTGGDLCVGTTDGSTLSSEPEWREIVFTSGYNLSADTQYAIVARVDGTNVTTAVYMRCDVEYLTYSSGAWLGSGDSGTSWEVDTDEDALFKEYGIVESPPSQNRLANGNIKLYRV